VQEPFRCTGCGALSAAATRCSRCGAATFELAPAPVQAAQGEPEGAELVSLQDVRAKRERRGAANRD
jgi:hypothetical protein